MSKQEKAQQHHSSTSRVSGGELPTPYAYLVFGQSFRQFFEDAVRSSMPAAELYVCSVPTAVVWVATRYNISCTLSLVCGLGRDGIVDGHYHTRALMMEGLQAIYIYILLRLVREAVPRGHR